MLKDSIYHLLTPRTARTLLLASALGLGLAAAAQAEEPAGPGAVFPSVEAAATDALDFAAERKGSSLNEMGGAISRVAGGFSYAMPISGGRETVSVKLGEEHVAWYYTHGARDRGELDRLNERISARDRQMVDRVDPLHRPLFVSTPSGRVIRYRDGRLAELKRVSSRIAASGAN